MTVGDIGSLPADMVEGSTNRRKTTLITVGMILVALVAVLAYGSLVGDAASLTDLE